MLSFVWFLIVTQSGIVGKNQTWNMEVWLTMMLMNMTTMMVMLMIMIDDTDDDDADDDADDDRLMESQTRKEAPIGRFGEAPAALLHI